jgi:hypothetical protein
MAPLTSKPLTKDFAMSRLLRAFVFGFFVSLFVVGFTINLIAYLWNNWVRDFFSAGPYNVQLILVVPMIFIVALIFTKIFWDVANLREAQRVRMPGTDGHMEPTTHAMQKAKDKFDPNPSAGERTIPAGPRGTKGLGAPSGGWDKARIP